MRQALHRDPTYRAQFAMAAERFDLFFSDLPQLQALILAGLTFKGALKAQEKVALLKSSFFSIELLEAMISAGQPFQANPIAYIWRRLEERGLVVATLGFMPNAFVTHQINLPLLAEFLHGDALLNLFSPASELPQRYAPALVAIDVETASGDRHRGSGFLAAAGTGQPPMLITCRHNVDPGEGIVLKQITTASGTTFPIEPFRLHPVDDLAVMAAPLWTTAKPMFRLRRDVEVFDDVYTLGYPKVPTLDTHVIGHRGEVNGHGSSCFGGAQTLLISNLVSPGYSGAPVLDRDGFCVGMSIRWLEGEWDGERARFSAALPSQVILDFNNW